MNAQRGVRCSLLLLTFMCGVFLPSAATVTDVHSLLDTLEGLLAVQCAGYSDSPTFLSLKQLRHQITTCERSIASHKALEATGVPIGLEDGYFPLDQVTVSSHYVTDLIRLRSDDGAWCAASNDENQWVTINLQNELMLIGIAIQGSGDPDKPCWIIRYRIEISMDGIHWGCVLDSHGQIEYYGGNVDVDSVSISHLTTSLAARYVRIIPKAWHGCICLRLEVYVEDLNFNPTGVPIGLEDKTFPLTQITVSSEAEEFAPVENIGLNGPGGWCAAVGDSDPYIEVDLQFDHTITGIVVQGASFRIFHFFVEEFQIETKKQGTEYKYIKDSYGHRKNFEGGRNSFNSISPSQIARYVRINITKSHIRACMRLEIYVNELYNPADFPEGVPAIQNGLISTISASSNWPKYLPSRSPLGTLPALPEYGGSWCAAQESTDTLKEWIQIDFDYVTTVYGVILQGDPTRDFWVSQFFVSTSTDGEVFDVIKSGDSSGDPKVFEGSTSRDGYAITKFATPLSARLIRIIPESWKDCICLRWEVYVEAITCDGANLPTDKHGTYSDNGDYSIGSTSTLQCNEGYHGVSTVTCTLFYESVGMWSATEDSCQAITCDGAFLPTDEHGTYSDNGDYSIGSTSTLQCNIGYHGVSTVTCELVEGVGQWTGTEGSCLAITCDRAFLPTDEHGTYSDNGDYSIGSTSTLQCDEGYHGDSTVTCELEEGVGQWTGTEGSCQEDPTCPADFSVKPSNKKVDLAEVHWVVDEGVTCDPPQGNFKSGLHTITCTLDSFTCDFQVTVEDIMPPNMYLCEGKRIRNGNKLVLSRRVKGSDNSESYTIICTRKADGENLPYDEKLEWAEGQTDVECIITDSAGLTDTMGPCELSITVGQQVSALQCPEDEYVTLTDEKPSVDMKWGENSDLECRPSVFDKAGTYEVLCYKGFQTCTFEFQVYVKKEECLEVEYPDGDPLFSGSYLDASKVEVSSTRSIIYHGADRLPLIDPANNPLAWCAAGTTAVDEYVYIDLGDPLYVFGIVLRGNNHEDFPAWVTSVRLEYVDSSGDTNEIGTFEANVSPNCDAVIKLPHPKEMKVLRIFPETFTPSNLLCMRVEVYAHLGN